MRASTDSGLNSTRRPKTRLTSPGVSLQVMGPAFPPQKSKISDTFSKFSIVAILVNRTNLSLTVLCVIPEKWLTKALVFVSSWRPPSWLNRFFIIIISSLFHYEIDYEMQKRVVVVGCHQRLESRSVCFHRVEKSLDPGVVHLVLCVLNFY